MGFLDCVAEEREPNGQLDNRLSKIQLFYDPRHNGPAEFPEVVMLCWPGHLLSRHCWRSRGGYRQPSAVRPVLPRQVLCCCRSASITLLSFCLFPSWFITLDLSPHYYFSSQTCHFTNISCFRVITSFSFISSFSITRNLLLSGLRLEIGRTIRSGIVLFLTSEVLQPLILAPIQ
jgi:hypothetical protein